MCDLAVACSRTKDAFGVVGGGSDNDDNGTEWTRRMKEGRKEGRTDGRTDGERDME